MIPKWILLVLLVLIITIFGACDTASEKELLPAISEEIDNDVPTSDVISDASADAADLRKICITPKCRFWSLVIDIAIGLIVFAVIGSIVLCICKKCCCCGCCGSRQKTVVMSQQPPQVMIVSGPSQEPSRYPSHQESIPRPYQSPYQSPYQQEGRQDDGRHQPVDQSSRYQNSQEQRTSRQYPEQQEQILSWQYPEQTSRQYPEQQRTESKPNPYGWDQKLSQQQNSQKRRNYYMEQQLAYESRLASQYQERQNVYQGLSEQRMTPSTQQNARSSNSRY